MEQLQISTLKGSSPLDKELFVQNELAALEEAENMFLKQKSKVRWLKEGDKCTKYFHSVIVIKNKKYTFRVLINAQGNLESIDGIISVLNHFYELSGLKLNVSKTELFAAGISPRNLEVIHCISGFKQSHLPVRYLGVPLITKKLSDIDCQPLLDKIKLRLYHWSSKMLSYAGRLELIKTVMYSVANYWCRQFILPQSIINRINQLCSRFLWKGNDHAANGARIIQKILAGEGSLWVAWLNYYVLKNSNFMDMSASNAHSWNIKKLLKLRFYARSVLNAGTKNTKDIWEAIRERRSKGVRMKTNCSHEQSIDMQGMEEGDERAREKTGGSMKLCWEVVNVTQFVRPGTDSFASLSATVLLLLEMWLLKHAIPS
ncbi:uncharacterized protein LOC120218411 [Hibiscus syriacus]|uniref:uncharacterized protein LOC120218411 n=1 Tax=Hibiscus syriacus TaxID=106335 RepID=UPI00192287C1|nr:uncharacterized protein LOC120218411 [Hibiscus syriacus]